MAFLWHPKPSRQMRSLLQDDKRPQQKALGQTSTLTGINITVNWLFCKYSHLIRLSSKHYFPHERLVDLASTLPWLSVLIWALSRPKESVFWSIYICIQFVLTDCRKSKAIRKEEKVSTRHFYHTSMSPNAYPSQKDRWISSVMPMLFIFSRLFINAVFNRTFFVLRFLLKTCRKCAYHDS